MLEYEVGGVGHASPRTGEKRLHSSTRGRVPYTGRPLPLDLHLAGLVVVHLLRSPWRAHFRFAVKSKIGLGLVERVIDDLAQAGEIQVEVQRDDSSAIRCDLAGRAFDALCHGLTTEDEIGAEVAQLGRKCVWIADQDFDGDIRARGVHLRDVEFDDVERRTGENVHLTFVVEVETPRARSEE